MDNKLLRKKRTMEFFIDAALKIIDEEGVEGVTIRKVADLAGYNSATLYNYFDSLDHLLCFTSMTYLEDYINEIESAVKGVDNPCEIYKIIWFLYADHCYKNPDLYYYLFFSPLPSDIEKWAREFYSMFPLKSDNFSPAIKNMLNTPKINDRSFYLIKPCIEEGVFSEEQGRDIDTLVICVFESILGKVRNGVLEKKKGLEMTKYYINKVFDAMS